MASRRVILRTGFSPGDVVLMTAAVRDLHLTYPGKFVTDVRTPAPELWEHNPHITPLREAEPGVELVDCTYPLIDHANTLPYHAIHGFIHFLNERFNLTIRPTAFKGDIHLSPQEKAWFSQVRELCRSDLPFWIVSAGGKFDVTIKWWGVDRYQAVVDHFRDRVQFVQVGATAHYHPGLTGVIDLRGKTTLRELVRLVYHSQGILCPVTALMHLAAAVEVKADPHARRPCVVVAGGREPEHWEAYPGHQFIHTTSALDCCAQGGCWRDRALPLGDGDPRDRAANRCVDMQGPLPRCLDIITPGHVIQRIESYFQGGALSYLKEHEVRAGKRAAAATRTNTFDDQPLTLSSARLACDRFVAQLPEETKGYSGRGIVMCAGGVRYFTNAWVCINVLRDLGCRLPIQLWHLGPEELDEPMAALMASLDVDCVDGLSVRRECPARRLGGWGLKPFAMLHSPFAEVLFLDADNVPVCNPEELFDWPQYRASGAVFWPDYGRDSKGGPIWRCIGRRRPSEPEFETGQILVDKHRVWKSLCLALWFNEHSDFFYRYLHGDKETFHLAFRRLSRKYHLVPHPIRTLVGTMCQHDFNGRRLFQHRNTDKWNLFLRNRHVRGFRLEEACRRHLTRLQGLWDGRMSSFVRTCQISGRTCRGTLTFCAVMISCPERARVREQTLKHLAKTDWDSEPIVVQLDFSSQVEDPCRRQTRTALQALRQGLASGDDYILFLEDDLQFNQRLGYNIRAWIPIKEGWVTLAGLYNPGLAESACDVQRNAVVVSPHAIYGSQAFVLSRETAKFIVDRWHAVAGMQDIRMSRLAGRMQRPIFYHAPSLIQHVGRVSTWGGGYHRAMDFDPQWRAPR